MKTKALLFFICFVSFCSASFATDVYKTVDENGRIIYSDKPHNDSSEKVELNESNSLPAPSPSTAPKTSSSASAPTSYQVAITSPENEYHVMPGTFKLAVQASTEPSLAAGHALVLTDNGQAVNGMVIENIHRGTHLLAVEVFDSKGRSLGRSAPVTVYVHRPGLN